MNPETELIKEYIGVRIDREIRMGEVEQKNQKGDLILNDKVSRWKQRLIRLKAQLLFFCDNTEKALITSP